LKGGDALQTGQYYTKTFLSSRALCRLIQPLRFSLRSMRALLSRLNLARPRQQALLQKFRNRTFRNQVALAYFGLGNFPSRRTGASCLGQCGAFGGCSCVNTFDSHQRSKPNVESKRLTPVYGMGTRDYARFHIVCLIINRVYLITTLICRESDNSAHYGTFGAYAGC